MTRGDELLKKITLARHVQHQYQLENYTVASLNSITKSLGKARNELLNELYNRDLRLPAGHEEKVLRELNDLTLGIQYKLTEDITEAAEVAGQASFREYGKIMSFDGRLADTVGFNFVSLSADQLRAMVVDVPVGGKLLKNWVADNFERQIVGEIKEDIMTGMFKGESTKKLAARVGGSFYMLDHEAITLTRTYVASINNRAAESVYKANSDIIDKEEWSATLEISSVSGRGTCFQCAALDGQSWPIDSDHPRPPIHHRCRCFLVPVTKSYKELGLNIPELEKAARPFTEVNGIPIDEGGKRKILDFGMFQGNAQDFIKSKGPVYLRNTVGPNRFRMLQAGEIEFEDLIDKNGNVRLLAKKDGKYTGLVPAKGLPKLDNVKAATTAATVKVAPTKIIRIKSIPDAQAAMENFPMSDPHKKALKDYTGEQYNVINSFLRGKRKKLPESVIPTMQNLEGFLKAAPKVETASYRGIGIDENLFNHWKSFKKGDPFRDNAFMSTTRDKSVIKDFLGNEQYQVEMNIKGKNGVLVEAFSDARSEKEILFQKGSEFRIEKIKVKKAKFSGKITMDLVEI